MLSAVDALDEKDAPRCSLCGGGHEESACETLRAAAAEGARPSGVPVRVYGGYLEARRALRANVPAPAVRTLQWLLAHLAEERGVAPELDLAAKVDSLCQAGFISARAKSTLVPRALAPGERAETAWALMSLVEQALTRMYLAK